MSIPFKKSYEWEYAGFSGLKMNSYIVLTDKKILILGLLEENKRMTGEELHKASGIQYAQLNDIINEFAKWGIIRKPEYIGGNRCKHASINTYRSPEHNNEINNAFVKASHFMDVTFLTKGKIKSHHRKKLGVVIVAIVEAIYNKDSTRSWGAKFAYVFPGDTENSEDLIKALEFARKRQEITCIETDRRPLYFSKKFQEYLQINQIKLIASSKFGSMQFIDSVFSVWKRQYVHNMSKDFERMSIIERWEYTVESLKKCFPEIEIEIPPLNHIFKGGETSKDVSSLYDP